MGNSPSISEPLPSSPIILVSIFVQPSILTFPVESTPELVITLHNPTAHPITFRFRQTPLDVPLCFGNVLYSGFWRIDDVTDHASSNNIPILTTPAHHSTLGAVPLATTGEAKSVRVVQEGDVLTVNPGKDGYKMSFSMKFQHGLEAGKRYLFSMQDFNVGKGRWCYGSEKAALNAIRVSSQQDQDGDGARWW